MVSVKLVRILDERTDTNSIAVAVQMHPSTLHHVPKSAQARAIVMTVGKANSANIFTLDAADVIATISPSYDFSTVSSTTTAPTSANATPSSEPMLVNNHHRSLAIGLGVGIGVGGFLLIALAVLYILKRKAKTKANGGYQKEEEISELDASWTPQLPEASPTAAKAGYTAPGDGVVHEIASGKTDPPIGAQEMDANTTYDWEPRNEPQPRDGGFRPEEHSEHR
ncbi:hypothetical protein ST47_g1755 [Ascochyta rabiei]|uniref:Mid2 domain-containing protein n=1 Tax=Didymella rabiei TaxID=5454 RepID=A0A163KME7_DIDRA|nr:hypothetical protein ST47_g1755 [Ascochyta rabiei]